MRKILNRKEQKTLRQSLRNTATTSEKLLWSKLRARKLGGFKFRRQCGIAKYVVDFYCPELNLAIEVDGDVHGEDLQKLKDKKKEKYITNLGIRVMRFTNGEITTSIDGVLERILSNHPPTPSLSKEGEP